MAPRGPSRPTEPGKSSVSESLRPPHSGQLFARELAQAHEKLDALARALDAIDFEAAFVSATAFRAIVKRLHDTAATGAAGTTAVDDIAALERAAEPLLVQAPTASDDAYRERFGGRSSSPRPRWGAESKKWQDERRGDASAKPLPDALRTKFSHSLGHSLDDVRVHTGDDASSAAAAQSARAFAVDQDIYFANGAYDPDSATGEHLIAHEVAHTVQQRGGAPLPQYKLAVSQPGDALEAEADRAADAMVSGRSAGGLSHATTHIARDTGTSQPKVQSFPIPVTLIPYGDQFDFTFKTTAADKLEITATYKGPHAALPKAAVNTITLKKPPPGVVAPTFKPLIGARGDSELWIDLFSDQTHLLVVKDDVMPDPTAFDKRLHKFSVNVNGSPADKPAYVTLTLAPGRSVVQSRGGPGDNRVSTQSLKIGHDEFTLAARRFGDSNKIQLHVTGADGASVRPDVLVPMADDIAAVSLKVLSNDGRTVRLSLDHNASEDVRLVHTFSGSDGPKGQTRMHTLRTFDRDGMLLGITWVPVTGPKIDIPANQDESKAKPELDKEWPTNRPPAQDDRPGETTRVIQRPGAIFEMRVDGDGDGSKELLVRLKAGPTTPPKADAANAGTTTEVRVEIIQVSSGKLVGPFTFHPNITALEPSMWLTGDGREAAKIKLGHGYYPGLGSIEPMLSIHPPAITDKTWVYAVETTLESVKVTFPAEATPQGSLVQDDLSKLPKQTPKLGGVMFRDLSIGPYADPFRFTLEPVGPGKVVFGVAGLNEASGGGVAADGFEILDPAKATALKPFDHNKTSASFTLGGPGFGADITIHDRLETHAWQGVEETPEVARQHVMTITGRAVPDGERTMKFGISQNRFQSSYSTEGTERQATTAALAVGGLARQAGAGTTANVFASMAQKAAAIRSEAAAKNLISPAMKKSWEDLQSAMNELDPMTSWDAMASATPAQTKRRGELQAKAAVAAEALVTELAQLTIGTHNKNSDSETRTSGGPGGWGYKNKYLDAKRQRFELQYRSDTGAMGLGAAIRGGEWKDAYARFDSLRVGFDQYLASKLDKEKGGELLYYGGLEREVGKVLTEGDGSKEGAPKRVWAVFVPNAKTLEANKNQESVQGGVPMQLYTWRKDGRWWLRDVTNPKKVYNDDVDATGHDTPPPELFAKLNWREHFPDGVIRYQVDGGHQGSQVIDDSEWGFWDWMEAIGMALGAAALVIGSLGYATPALVAIAASSAIGIATSIHNLREKSDHNALDATTIVIEVANIIANAAFFVGASSKIVVNTARSAALKGAQWTEGMAKFAKLADSKFIVVGSTAVGNLGSAVVVLTMTTQIHDQLKAIDEGGGTEGQKTRSKAMLISMLLANGVMTALAIRGDFPIMSGKAPPNIVLDFVNGRAIAHAGGVRIGGIDPRSEIHVDPYNVDANAGARWQSEQFTEAATHKPAVDAPQKVKDQQANAKALLDDEEFMKWYRHWMSGDEKLDFSHQPPRAKMKPLDGKMPPPEVEKKLQDFVNNSGIALYERAFENADKLRKVEAAVAKASGGKMAIDPTHPDWAKHRPEVVKALGGGPEAEAMLKRYEAARGGAFVDPVRYKAEHEHLTQLVPETELQKIRDLFHPYEVYVTGSATQPEKALTKDLADLDVFVVVPSEMNGSKTSPDLMHAIEKRAQGYEVLPNPQYLRKYNKAPNEKMTLDVKVMTPEQFFGMSTTRPVDATGKVRSPLNFHSLDRGLGGLTTAEVDAVSRVTQAVAQGKPPPPADSAEMRRMIGIGKLDPTTLPESVQKTMPKKAGVDEAAARSWAMDLANANPERMTKEQIEKDLTEYMKRREHVEALYQQAAEQAKQGKKPDLPAGITFEQLELAVKGDPKTGQRVPLTFSVEHGKLGHDINEAKRLFAEFQDELKKVFQKHGITDAVVVQLGSGTTGWSTAPGQGKWPDGVTRDKVGKPWTPKSDTDFAIFSDQALKQAMEVGAGVNPKNKQAGQYTTIKNTAKDGVAGFADTPLGKDLDKLSGDWNERIYGVRNMDGFDFKLNLDSSKPFRSAVPVLQVANPKIVPVAAASKPGFTAVREIPGAAGPYFGVTVQDPRVMLPVGSPGRREFHVTVLTPPEVASLPKDKRALLATEIGGAPVSGGIVNKPIGDAPGWQLKVSWPEAQKFRAKLGLPEKDLHVSLNGGIGDAIKARDAARVGGPDEL